MNYSYYKAKINIIIITTIDYDYNLLLVCLLGLFNWISIRAQTQQGGRFGKGAREC